MKEKAHIWRLSYVRMYYSAIEEGETPKPFAEIRAFIFPKDKPTEIQRRIISKRLENAVEDMTNYVFTSIKQAELSDKAYYEDEKTTNVLEVERKKKGEIKVEIDGYEAERVEIEEIKERLKRIYFNKIYRYGRIETKRKSTPAYEYDEYKILQAEKRIFSELSEEDPKYQRRLFKTLRELKKMGEAIE